MPRSAIDATRFTPTGPYVTSKFGPSSPTTTTTSTSTSKPPSSRPQETPQEKVARIRAAARKAKLDKISTFDKVVLVGRVWADRAHRFVAFGLIFSTVICGLYATVALGDMMLYNRRKRKEWYAAEMAVYAKYLEVATAAEAQGTATDEQIKFLEKERTIQKAEEERRNRWRLWKKTKEWLFKDLKREDGAVASEVATADSRAVEGSGGVLKAVEAMRKEAAEEERMDKERPQGGILDQLAGEKASMGSTGGSSSWWKGWAKDRNDNR